MYIHSRRTMNASYRKYPRHVSLIRVCYQSRLIHVTVSSRVGTRVTGWLDPLEIIVLIFENRLKPQLTILN